MYLHLLGKDNVFPKPCSENRLPSSVQPHPRDPRKTGELEVVAKKLVLGPAEGTTINSHNKRPTSMTGNAQHSWREGRFIAGLSTVRLPPGSSVALGIHCLSGRLEMSGGRAVCGWQPVLTGSWEAVGCSMMCLGLELGEKTATACSGGHLVRPLTAKASSSSALK